MYNHSYTTILNIHVHELVSIVYLFLILLILLFTVIFSFAFYKMRYDGNRNLWQEHVAQIISQAIFYCEGDELINLNPAINKLLQKRTFRQCVINEIISTNKNLSGASTTNLKNLYETLELHKDSARKLKSGKWHVVARGIHELAMMKQTKCVKEIFRLTNNANELVRNEAQCALVNFYEFSGLRFLSITTYQVSQWQQIQLLHKLKAIHPQNFAPLKKWLLSPNESVLVFALKLAASFKCYEVYGDVINCLQHQALAVKLQAIEYLKKMPGENTSDALIDNYPFENKTHKLSIIEALKNIGNDKQIPFLLQQLNDIDDDIKAASAKSLSAIHPSGTLFLQTHTLAEQKPWKEIFLQINNEHAA